MSILLIYKSLCNTPALLILSQPAANSDKAFIHVLGKNLDSQFVLISFKCYNRFKFVALSITINNND